MTGSFFCYFKEDLHDCLQVVPHWSVPLSQVRLCSFCGCQISRGLLNFVTLLMVSRMQSPYMMM